MSQRKASRQYGSATLSALRNRIDEYHEVLDCETFMASDLDGNEMAAQSIISFLKAQDAIHSVDTKQTDKSNKLYNVWGWRNYQDDLQEHWEERNELPCGCRAHIPAERDGDTYYCKFCGDSHNRETIKEAL